MAGAGLVAAASAFLDSLDATFHATSSVASNSLAAAPPRQPGVSGAVSVSVAVAGAVPVAVVLDDHRLLPVLPRPTYEHDTRLDAEQPGAHAPASLARASWWPALHRRQSRVRWLVLEQELVRAGISRDAASEQACAYTYT